MKRLIVFSLLHPGPLPASEKSKKAEPVSWQPARCSVCQVGHRVQGLETKRKCCQTAVAKEPESQQGSPLHGHCTAKAVDILSSVTFQEEVSDLAQAQAQGRPGLSALPGSRKRQNPSRKQSAELEG